MSKPQLLEFPQARLCPFKLLEARPKLLGRVPIFAVCLFVESNWLYFKCYSLGLAHSGKSTILALICISSLIVTPNLFDLELLGDRAIEAKGGPG